MWKKVSIKYLAKIFLGVSALALFLTVIQSHHHEHSKNNSSTERGDTCLVCKIHNHLGTTPVVPLKIQHQFAGPEFRLLLPAEFPPSIFILISSLPRAPPLS